MVPSASLTSWNQRFEIGLHVGCFEAGRFAAVGLVCFTVTSFKTKLPSA